MAVTKRFGKQINSIKGYYPGSSMPSLKSPGRLLSKKPVFFLHGKETDGDQYQRPRYFKYQPNTFHFGYFTKLSANKPEIYKQIENEIITNNFSSAFLNIESLLIQTPYDYKAMFLLSELYSAQGHRQKALGLYRKALAIKKFLQKKQNRQHDNQDPVFRDYSLKYTFLSGKTNKYDLQDNPVKPDKPATVAIMNRFLIQCAASAAIFIMLLFSSCKPNEITEDNKTNITLTINLQSSLTGKQIADNTEVQLKAEQFDKKAYSTNGRVDFILTIIKGQTIEFELSAIENRGHLAASKSFSAAENCSNNIEMTAKNWGDANINFTTKIGETIAPNINYTINENTGTTNNEGKGNVTLPFNTNNYNEPEDLTIQFTFSGEKIKTNNQYEIIKGEEAKEEEESNYNYNFNLLIQEYQHQFTVNIESSIPEKTPPLTTANGFYDHGNGAESFSLETKVINFISEEENEDVTVSVSNVPGHYDGNINVTNTGSALKNGQTVTLTLEGIMYTANVDFSAENSQTQENIPNASFQYKLNNIEYSTTGPGTINFTLATDANNILWLETNNLTVNTSAPDYQARSNDALALVQGSNNFHVSLVPEVENYTISGKIITDNGESRHNNTTNALKIIRSDGTTTYYASTNSNGEFSKTIQARAGEKLTVAINIPGQRENTLTIIYDPQTTTGQGLQYSKNRLVESSWDLYQTDHAFVTPEEISKYPLTIIPLSNESATNDTIKWMLSGGTALRGSDLYFGTLNGQDIPMKKYICTTNYASGEQMSQVEIDKTINAMNITEELMYRPQIGQAFPLENNITISPTKLYNEELNDKMFMYRAGIGYYNGTRYVPPEDEARMIAGNARGPPAALMNTLILENMEAIGGCRDPPTESGLPTTNGYAFVWDGENIAGLNQTGKVLVTWNHNSEPETGKMYYATKGDWDATIQDWKTTPYQ